MVSSRVFMGEPRDNRHTASSTMPQTSVSRVGQPGRGAPRQSDVQRRRRCTPAAAAMPRAPRQQPARRPLPTARQYVGLQDRSRLGQQRTRGRRRPGPAPQPQEQRPRRQPHRSVVASVKPRRHRPPRTPGQPGARPAHPRSHGNCPGRRRLRHPPTRWAATREAGAWFCAPAAPRHWPSRSRCPHRPRKRPDMPHPANRLASAGACRLASTRLLSPSMGGCPPPIEASTDEVRAV